jgi:transposase
MNEELRHEIVRRLQEGRSQRGVAADLGIGRETVRRVALEQRQARDGARPSPPSPAPRSSSAARRPSLLDEYDDLMRRLLARYPQITAVRMHEELRRHGFAGRYSIVRDRLRALRPPPAPAVVRRFETAPGKQAQMDYAQYDLDFTEEGRRRVYLFSYVLAYSRRQYLCFTESQDFATTIRQHVRAFEHLGGVAAECLYDNLKVVVARYESDLPVYNTRFLAFATHYGFRPVACRPRRPETKGKVERPFYYAETNLLNGRSFRSLAHLNEFTLRWLAETADVRVHRQTGRRPIDLHAEEQPHLIPLPANPFDAAEVVYRSVDCEGCITYRQNQYSAPERYLGQVLPVRITEEALILYGPDLEEIGRHQLLPRSCVRQRQVLPEHRPPDERRQQYELLERSFAEWGQVGQRYLAGLIQAHRHGKAQARKILALRTHYHLHDLKAALERALTYGAFSFAAIERILHVQAQPKTALEMLADQEQERLSELFQSARVAPRPTAAYQHLLLPLEPDGQEEQPCADPQGADPELRSGGAGAESECPPPGDPRALPDAAGSADGGTA